MDPEGPTLAAVPPYPPPRRGLFAALRDHTFRSLKSPDYRLYFFGQIVSFTGSWMQSAALMWLVFDRTHDAFWPPLMLVAQVGPTLLFGALGGALADRWPKRSIIFFTQSLFLANALTLTVLVASDRADPWLLFAVQLCNGVVQSLDLPARLAFVPVLVPREHLINAVSLNSLLFNCARALGPAVAGGLFFLADELIEAGWLPGSRPVTVGAIWCFTLNSLSYAAVLIALRRIRVTGARSDREQGSMLDGIRYVLANPALGWLLVLTGFVSIAAWPALSLFPAYTKFALGHAEKEYSVLVSSLGGGALVAALVNATFGTIARRGPFLSAGAGLAALGLLGLSLAENLLAAGASAACLGFGLILYLSTGQSSLQLSVPDHTRGRVMALWAMTLSASAPVGHLAAGAAATEWPVRDVLTVLASATGLLALAVVGLLIARRNR